MNAEEVSLEVLLITVLFFCGIGLSFGASVLGISELAVLGTFVFFSALFLGILYLRKVLSKVAWLLYLIGTIGLVSGEVIFIAPLWIGIASPFFHKIRHYPASVVSYVLNGVKYYHGVSDLQILQIF